MPKSEIRQFEKLVTDSEHVLVLLPENPRGDQFSAALAIAHFCDFKSIKTTIAFNDPYEQISLFSFLPKPTSTKITHSISGTRDLILSFNTKYNKILDVKTEVLNEELKIYVTPEKGMVDSRDFSFLPGKFPFDVIITLGATDKESMGKLYEEIPDIFYELPIINIDNKSSNEQFGQVNIVSNIASSISEVVAEIFEQLQKDNLSKDCAQCLLTGIISETHSFQNNKTTPKSMTLSSKLIELGASQQTIIQNLYRNLPFSLLKLWGRAMKNFTTSKYNEKTVISSLTYKDIEQTEAKKHHIYSILEKMKENYPSGQIFILFYENEKAKLIALIDMKRSNINLDKSDIKNISELPNKTYRLPLASTTIPTATKEICSILAPYTKQIK
ncbi:MAG: DHH family phosphoesterase [Candidatus Moraniibacteriota bacterium]|jgi:nanoRNase/pAp phosphatase (c-di-AMP/oligoRNAs hydrolase)